MSSKSKRRRAGEIAKSAANEIVRCEEPKHTFALVKLEGAEPLREVCPVLEPWAVDESVCHDHELPPHEAIETRAREIWESRGRPTGADLEIWLEAQNELVAATV